MQAVLSTAATHFPRQQVALFLSAPPPNAICLQVGRVRIMDGDMVLNASVVARDDGLLARRAAKFRTRVTRAPREETCVFLTDGFKSGSAASAGCMVG